jgi:hypothetical protein
VARSILDSHGTHVSLSCFAATGGRYRWCRPHCTTCPLNGLLHQLSYATFSTDELNESRTPSLSNQCLDTGPNQPAAPHKDFSDLYEKMSGTGASASGAHRSGHEAAGPVGGMPEQHGASLICKMTERMLP